MTSLEYWIARASRLTAAWQIITNRPLCSPRLVVPASTFVVWYLPGHGPTISGHGPSKTHLHMYTLCCKAAKLQGVRLLQ